MEPILRRDEVERATRLSKATLYRMVNAGEFPLPIRLGRRAVAWRRDEVEQWINTRDRAFGVGAVQEVAEDRKRLRQFIKRIRPSDDENLAVDDVWAAWCRVHTAPKEDRRVGGITRSTFTRRLRELIPDLPLVRTVKVKGIVQRGWEGWKLVA